MQEKIKKIPLLVKNIADTLIKNGFEAYFVGGCVRSLALHMKPKDWDITTNAKPEEIQKLFPHSVYENKYGTVGVINDTDDETLKVVEVTPYRLESGYSDKRRTDEAGYELIDLFGGQDDLKKKIIKAVGDPDGRFNEDALRILRAVRLAAELGFEIEPATKKAIEKHAGYLKEIAQERIHDEFVKVIMSDRAKEGIELMNETGMLKYILPELEEGIGVEQNKAHSFTVWEHNLKSLEHAVSKKWSLEIRLAALLHDVAKPATRRWGEEKGDWTFYGHDVIGAKMTAKILARLKFSKKQIDLIAKLVRYHLFFSDTEKITLSAVRRLVRNVGPENIWELMNVRFCDRIGMGRPKESPYRLRKYESMIDEAMRAPLSVTALKIDGTKLMEILKIPPGPKIGQILNILFEEVLDEPGKNTAEYLEKRALELNVLGDKELEYLANQAKDKKNELEQAEIKEIRQKWWVK